MTAHLHQFPPRNPGLTLARAVLRDADRVPAVHLALALAALEASPVEADRQASRDWRADIAIPAARAVAAGDPPRVAGLGLSRGGVALTHRHVDRATVIAAKAVLVTAMVATLATAAWLHLSHRVAVEAAVAAQMGGM